MDLQNVYINVYIFRKSLLQIGGEDYIALNIDYTYIVTQFYEIGFYIEFPMTKNIQNSINFTCKCKYNEITLLHHYLLKAFKDTKIAIEAYGLGD